MLRGAHGIALDRRVKEDSPEYFGFLHSLLNQQTAASPPPHAAPAPPPAAPMPPPPESVPQRVAHVDLEHVEHHEPDEARDMTPFVSAPVSRGGDHYVVGGEHEPSASSVRLSKAEVNTRQRQASQTKSMRVRSSA